MEDARILGDGLDGTATRKRDFGGESGHREIGGVPCAVTQYGRLRHLDLLTTGPGHYQNRLAAGRERDGGICPGIADEHRSGEVHRMKAGDAPERARQGAAPREDRRR